MQGQKIHNNQSRSARKADNDQFMASCVLPTTVGTGTPFDDRCPTVLALDDPVWIQGVARSAGQCAMSGVAIRRGDAVYRRGSRGRRVPVNVGAMIRASAFA
ncbi:DUF3331 domain-containing protein [Paraburkholderia sartisoli]|uniref:DUF3331 domain-containing protein n=1 Tax=Paraburkholderia sartisoli TaxID=83784 RepID=UPI000B86B1DF|nr:DUF3331 domain-containing protein [Paraburkholderia sartisoli]